MSKRCYCIGLHSKASVYLIAILDIVVSLILFLLFLVALADLHKVSTLIERDTLLDYSFEYPGNENSTHEAIREYRHLHGKIVSVLLFSSISLLLALGLFLGIKKEVECLLKSWLIYSSLMILFFTIYVLWVTNITTKIFYVGFIIGILVRIYEIFIVFDFLRNTTFRNLDTISTASSTEILHNV